MQTFWEWLAGDLEPKPLRTPDQMLVTTIASFKNGLTRREVYQRFRTLNRKVIDQLLTAYVEIGQLAASDEGAETRYRARAG